MRVLRRRPAVTLTGARANLLGRCQRSTTPNTGHERRVSGASFSVLSGSVATVSHLSGLTLNDLSRCKHCGGLVHFALLRGGGGLDSGSWYGGGRAAAGGGCSDKHFLSLTQHDLEFLHFFSFLYLPLSFSFYKKEYSVSLENKAQQTNSEVSFSSNKALQKYHTPSLPLTGHGVEEGEIKYGAKQTGRKRDGHDREKQGRIDGVLLTSPG